MICESLDLYHRLDQKLGVAISLERLAELASEKNALYAAKLFGLAEAIREAIGAPLPPVDRPFYKNAVAKTRAQLDETAFARAWVEGKTISPEKMTGFVLSNSSLDPMDRRILKSQ